MWVYDWGMVGGVERGIGGGGEGGVGCGEDIYLYIYMCERVEKKNWTTVVSTQGVYESVE